MAAAPPKRPASEMSSSSNPPPEPEPTKTRKIKPSIHKIRAHANPLADALFPYPTSPDQVDWVSMYPEFFKQAAEKSPPVIPKVEFADVGCGFGGLTVALSAAFPETLTVGLEIRKPVSQFVKDRIATLREQNPGKYQNIACLRCNAMKHIPNHFLKGQLSKIFFLFPDPHFKKSKHRRRIVSPALVAEYAYVVKPGGRIYTITDVEDLHKWMVKHLSENPLFRRMEASELAGDITVPLVENSSEESKKVDAAKGKKFLAVFERLAPPPL